MRYREKLNIVLIRDNGPRSSFRLKRSNFILLALFLGCMPFVAAFFIAQSFLLWQENVQLRGNMERFESDYQQAESRAERLENLEELLKQENVQGRELVMRKLAESSDKKPKGGEKEPASPEAEPAQEMAEGPGHEDFPALDSGRVIVSNVQARARPGNSLRIALDLRNPEKEPLLSGEVEAILVTANGERRALELTPSDVGAFRIARFKRTVMNAKIPRDVSLVNAQIILEVKDQAGKPLYSNIFAVLR